MYLVGTFNGSYKIIKQGITAVIGKSETAPDPYVCWTYETEDGETDFRWGSYGTEKSTLAAFNKKECISA